MPSDLLVGVDLGTTALKAGLFDRSGRLLSVAERGYDIDRPAEASAEQDADAWLLALEQVLEELAGDAPGQQAQAVGICSQVNTHVFVDANGEALRPAIVWQDQRCDEDARRLRERLAAAAPEKAPRFALAASSLPARAEWLAREEPEVWEKTAFVLSPKDYLTNWLCRPSEPLTDQVTPFDVVDDNGVYDATVLDLVPGLTERVPRVRRMDDLVGSVCRDLPLVGGASVAVGTMDAWGSVYGSAVIDHGDAMEVAGTSEILGLLSRDRHETPGVVSFLPVDGLHLHAGPTQAGGAALAWFGSVVGLSISEAIRLAGLAPAGSNGLIFAPHLLGERAPIWDADVRGAFIGLSSDHTLAHLCRAVLEGVAFSARHLLETLEAAGGLFPSELRTSGGGSHSDVWCQIKADVLEVPLRRLRVQQSGCLGASLIASSACGFSSTVREAVIEGVHLEETFEPAAQRSIYDELYALYRDFFEVMKPTHAALSAIRRRHESSEESP